VGAIPHGFNVMALPLQYGFYKPEDFLTPEIITAQQKGEKAST
jgi:hypothetical protein